MSDMKVLLMDGLEIKLKEGATLYDAAVKISPSLGKEALAGIVNGEKRDLNYLLENDDKIEIITFDSPEGKEIFHHSTSHIMAQAVKKLFPKAKFAIGPAIKDGFYYDFEVDRPFTPEDLIAIEKKMKEITEKDFPFKKTEITKKEAEKIFAEKDAIYKLELLNDITDDKVSLYQQGDFMDLCRGPHIPSTKKLKAFKLLSVAGAYWRGSEKNKMLQRIYGTSFNKKSALDDYLKLMEEAKKRDHRKIGKSLKLFSFHEDGVGFPFFHPKGMILRNILEDYWKEEHQKAGYTEVKTPIILNKSLWIQSGHWDHYKENMYFTKIDEEDYAIKPMNCPGGILIYKCDLHSYRDLPLRMGELGLVHRHELSGVLHGLFRVRCFTQDDAHIFMTPEQIKDEIKGVIDLTDCIYKTFGFNYHVELSTKPENAMGSDEIWEKATNSLEETLIEKKINYTINEGDGAFYGPKIDFHLEDCIGRNWQCGTIQIDFNMPEKFDLYYINKEGEKERPVMLHRTILGSIERFIGILIENYAGAFPLWLAPVQVKLLPIADRHIDYGKKIVKILKENNIRVEFDEINDKIGAKIRKAEMEKIPYMLIFGDKEVEEGFVSVRKRGKGDLGKIKLTKFIEDVLKEIKEKTLS
ncbi:MAG: threonine--tRNA ligase [Candidatus Caldatribacteriota bacterium]|nr:threonine--tRNA ligase [Candidatus Caldatribacteriota bacterium]